MASVNKVILIGNLGRDPETRYTTGGDAVTNINIATTDAWKDKNGEKQEKTEWHRVVLFGRQAEIAGEYLKKGRPVYIEGRLQTRKYTDKDGVEKYATEIVGRPHAAARRPRRRQRRRRRLRRRRERRRSPRKRRDGRRRQAGRRRQEPRGRQLRRRHSFLTNTHGAGPAGRAGAAGYAGCASLPVLPITPPPRQTSPVVENEVLPRRRRPLRRLEHRPGTIVGLQRNAARGVGHPVPGLGAQRRQRRRVGRRPGDPVHRLRVDDGPVQQRMVVPLHGDQRVALEVLGGDEPRQVGAVAHAADPQPLALSERVVGEAVMAADDRAVGRLDRPRRPRQVAGEEIAERPLADEADPGRILLGPGRDALAPGDGADFALGQFPDREQHRCQLLLRQLVQEVALVLGRVGALQQFHAPPGAAHAGVVAGGDVVGAERARMIQERAELDLAVAQHVGVRRAPGPILARGTARTRARGTRPRSSRPRARCR